MVGVLGAGEFVAPAFEDFLGVGAQGEGFEVGAVGHPLLVEARGVDGFLDVHLVVDDVEDGQ